ncbi:MAG: OmpA family protein [Gammaproteobacteria bacterium]|uniref:OmpA family protein n=1 Tax=Rhodoferax sp. TaxID=50421 RepID=UPI0017AE0C69|nr:OmpA family protein [Rhodoferax sp.]MBU3900173.1 OmpA family protein [Gammaproteobacteria bacterium]MBA3058694.1 OmpA family protein [Rhodoferax sp.]MBU3997617.1 OmpA family protein [Gammaproteobacteria bacterium]MBU4018356.1 OmpA family protein [Gammaproteobacteria bacterium]MBU4082211.1 OmpA family protein [Gammaproteobacteria bacterium]
MKKHYSTAIVLAIATLVGACSSGPRTTSLLDQTRSDYRMAQGNPQVATYAPLEMKQAGDAMAQANDAANDNDSAEKVDKLAYLAKQQIALTQEVAKQKAAEAQVANAGKERDQIRLQQRTNEADQAKASAQQAQLAAQVAQGEAADAQRRTQLAQVEAADAQRKTQDAQARAAQLEAQLADLAAKKTARGMVITMGDVLFGTDLARLNADGMRSAQKLADVLQQNPERTVLVEGFTDSTGATAHNQALSERRAAAVQNALLELGVARERVAIRGYGESYPVAANDTAQNRQLNRRVEIVLSDNSGKISNR